MNAIQQVPVGKVFGQPMTLGEIARYDKNLAYVLHQMGTVGEPDQMMAPGVALTGGWEMLDVAATWTTQAANQSVVGQVSGIVETDLWVKEVVYTVQRPNAFAGNILKSLSDEMNKLNPNINLQLVINSYCRYLISVDYTPLENVITKFSCVCPQGIVLSCGATIQANFTNLRALAADEIPTIATITMHAIRLPRGLYSACGYAQVVQYLRSAGLLENTCVAPCP